MLDQLRAEALALIAATPQCTLSTAGPAGVQASLVTCLVRENCIYVLIPSTADHLFNLESETEVMLTAQLWQLRGAALVFAADDGRQVPAACARIAQPFVEGHRIVEVFPMRMHIEAIHPYQYRLTIDFNARLGGASS